MGRAGALSMVAAMAGVALCGAMATGCRDVTRFSNDGDHYEGQIVAGSFVRAGIDDGTSLCLVLDANHLQDTPGTIRSSDGRFTDTPLRPIPQIWHDPLSTLSFGEGRMRNLVYVVTPNGDAGPLGAGADAMLVLSLMQSGDVEVRMLRGAPAGAGAAPSSSPNLFGVFALSREKGSCSF